MEIKVVKPAHMTHTSGQVKGVASKIYKHSKDVYNVPAKCLGKTLNAIKKGCMSIFNQKGAQMKDQYYTFERCSKIH